MGVLNFTDDNNKVRRINIGTLPVRRYRTLHGLGWSGITELCSTSFGRCKAVLGSLANHVAFLLGHQRHDADREPVGVRHVRRDEVHAAIAEV